MELMLKPTVKLDVYEVYKWEYEPPYDIYNSNIDFSSSDEIITYFLNPEYSFHTIFEQKSNELIGICSFGPDGKVAGGNYSTTAIDIGMGIKPEWTGRGLGIEFVNAVTTFAEQKFQPPMLRVTIAEFNERAQRVWQNAGFREVSRFKAIHGKRPFIIYTRSVHP